MNLIATPSSRRRSASHARMATHPHAALISLLALIAGLLLPFVPASAAGPDSSAVAGLVTASRDPLPPGSLAIVQAEGDCLRVRPSASLSGTPLACVPSGSVATVLPATQDADGYRWQLVTASGYTGWVADVYLGPYSGAAPTPVTPSGSSSAAGTAACVNTALPVRPGLNTTLAPVGVNLVLWGGGTMNALSTASESQGCRITAVYANRAGGGLVSYLVGAPDFVNEEWASVFSGGRIPPGTAMMLICAATGSQVTVIAPAITQANPPRKIGLKPAPQIGAAAAVVLDGTSGAVLYEKNGMTPRAPASLTKIATAILAVEGTEMSSGVTVDVDGPRMAATDQSSIMGLRPGDCYSMRDLLYGLMLPSGNDAAIAIAKYEAGSEAAFVKQMNTLVRRLGLSGTTFTDPHGLGSPQHRSTAYDLAMMARYGMTLPLFREVVGTPVRTTSGTRTLSLYNTNSLLSRYPGTDGVKTGFTDEAGRTIVVSAVRGGNRVFVVLLNDPNREESAVALLDWAFQNYQW